ncbi:MAG TPA: hypothetical protein VNJ04_20570 [Gemmatimonadaceae bacterium]|nr:hypothetical protein [Gemmatimonadaceae bacterium]
MNALAPALLDTVRRLRLARLCLRRSRERYLAVAEALRLAIAMLAEQDIALDDLRVKDHTSCVQSEPLRADYHAERAEFYKRRAKVYKRLAAFYARAKVYAEREPRIGQRDRAA